jgi:hypothetical protein
VSVAVPHCHTFEDALSRKDGPGCPPKYCNEPEAQRGAAGRGALQAAGERPAPEQLDAQLAGHLRSAGHVCARGASTPPPSRRYDCRTGGRWSLPSDARSTPARRRLRRRLLPPPGGWTWFGRADRREPVRSRLGGILRVELLAVACSATEPQGPLALESSRGSFSSGMTLRDPPSPRTPAPPRRLGRGGAVEKAEAEQE